MGAPACMVVDVYSWRVIGIPFHCQVVQSAVLLHGKFLVPLLLRAAERSERRYLFCLSLFAFQFASLYILSINQLHCRSQYTRGLNEMVSMVMCDHTLLAPLLSSDADGTSAISPGEVTPFSMSRGGICSPYESSSASVFTDAVNKARSSKVARWLSG